MRELTHIVALSGGKDSTAMAIRLREKNPKTNYKFIVTPTGDELPEMKDHWNNLESVLGEKLIVLKNEEYPTIYDLIEHFQALPNFRQRWCTRILKIEVAQEYYKKNLPAIIYVGLRYDEEHRRGNKIFDKDIIQEFPLREWRWGIKDVIKYLKEKNITIPRRTDCAMCFYQRIDEWWTLWKKYPTIWERLCNLENKIGHTFLSKGKFGKTWPHKLSDIGKEFKKGRRPRRIIKEQNQKCQLCIL